MYNGSPRALCLLEDPVDKNEHLSIAAGCTISCSVMTHFGLLKAQHLLPENVLVSTNNVVPGLVDRIHPESTISKLHLFIL